jgi:hypothetical protein
MREIAAPGRVGAKSCDHERQGGQELGDAQGDLVPARAREIGASR